MMQWPLILVLALGGDETPVRPGDSAPGKPLAQALDNGRPPISATDLKLLRETNIFAPQTVKRTAPRGPRPSSSSKPAAPAKPKPPVVTGIFYDTQQQTHIVFVEDRNDAALKQFKEPKFLKPGDQVAGLKVDSVSAEKAVFSKGGVPSELHVGDPLADAEIKAVSPTDEGLLVPPQEEETPAAPGASKTPASSAKTEAKPVDPKQQSQILEGMKKKAGKTGAK